MLRFVMRHGLVRLIGGRAVPVLYAWDLVILADRARRIPAVDRGLRRGAGVARVGLGAAFDAALERRPRRVPTRVPGRRRRHPAD